MHTSTERNRIIDDVAHDHVTVRGFVCDNRAITCDADTLRVDRNTDELRFEISLLRIR